MRILHLSDLHFGTKANANNWYSQLADDLVTELSCKTIEFLVLSGDIANKATPGEYSAAVSFLAALTAEFKIDKTKIIIVPGNHDVNWGQAKKSYRLTRREGDKWPQDEEGQPDPDRTIDKGEYIEVVNGDAYKRRFDNFRYFYGLITGCEYSSDYQNQGLLYSFPESGLVFLGLNSAWQLDHHYTARAGINPDALSNALTQLRRGAQSLSEAFKIAVWHHPLNSHAEDRLTNQDFMQRLALAGFSLGMHGHIHKSEASLYCYDMSAGGRHLNIITAGTFGAPVRQWFPGYPLQYNLITLTDEKLIVDTRCRRELNGAWKPDPIWLQGSGRDPLPRYEVRLPVSRKLPASVPAQQNQPQESEEKEARGLNSGKDKERITIPGSAGADHSLEIETASKTILIVTANPLGTSRLRLAEEVREILSVLSHATRQKYRVEVRWAVRVRDLRQALLEVKPHIVHFSGHGKGIEGIVLEDDEGQPALLSSESLADLFRLLERSPECFVECVFLNACFTEIQSNALKPFVEYVIGIDKSADDLAAIEFARGFYEALSHGRNYEQAYEFGCNAAHSVGHGVTPVIQKNEVHRDKAKPRNRPAGGNLSMARKTTLFLSSEPTSLVSFRWDEEYREISEELRPALVRGDIALESRVGVRLEDVYVALHDIQPQIVHFTGLGRAEGLIFENSKGEAELVQVKDLQELFELTRIKYECIVLNADNSEECVRALVSYTEYAIGTAGPASDRSHILFAKGFYRGLAANRSIEDSYRMGRLEVRVKDRSAAEIYRLHSRAGNESEK